MFLEVAQLQVRYAGAAKPAVHDVSFGLQAGAQSTAVFLLFMTDAALKNFQDSRGWTAGVDASVTVITVGANAQLTSATSQQPVIGYILSNQGLMAGLTVDGTRITRLQL